MNKRLCLLLAISVLLAVVLPGTKRLPLQQWTAHARTIDARNAFQLSIPVTAIVELEGEAVLAREAHQAGEIDPQTAEARGREADLIAEQDKFVSLARQISPSVRVVERLTKLANAVSVEVKGTELAQISVLPGVKSVELTQVYTASLSRSVSLMNAPVVWQRLGGPSVAGRGIKIAIIDSGIDITNPMFSASGFTSPPSFPRGDSRFTNSKVIVAKAFLPDAAATPDDEEGHGTNVAGIAAGNENTPSPLGPISGVAPYAYLGNYRVLDSEGSGRNDLIARALEEAVTDGFDVVNMSLGGAASAGLSFLDRAVENAVAAGVTVVVSAGNRGGDGEMSITSPGTAPSAITVTAFTNSHSVGTVVNVTGPMPVPTGLAGIRAAKSTGGSAPFDGNVGPFAYADVRPMGEGFACTELPSGSLTGLVALIERGNCPFSQKVLMAERAGAAAAVVYNSTQASDGGDALLNMNVSGTAIPSVFVGHNDGMALRAWLSEHPDARSRLAAIGESDIPSKVVSAGSSTGPTVSGILKPDVAAPGIIIYSGAIRKANGALLAVSDPSGFLAVSGTSQAAPHVAGAAALLKQLNPSWTPARIKSAIVSSAVPDLTTNGGAAAAGILMSGAGRVDLDRASSVSAAVAPATLSFGIEKLKKNDRELAAQFDITNVASTAGVFRVSLENLNADPEITVTASVSTFTLQPGEKKGVSVSISARKKATRGDYTGFAVITGPGTQTLRVPYWVRFVLKKKQQ